MRLLFQTTVRLRLDDAQFLFDAVEGLRLYTQANHAQMAIPGALEMAADVCGRLGLAIKGAPDDD